ncbi:MAG: TldD/PmbA family protein [Nitrospirae bacterium]|nr:TldD/PmbA family protein [Nitrospirota bacterium]
MINTDNGFYQELLKKVISRGGEYVDIFIEQRRSAAVQMEDDKIEKVIDGSKAGIGIRLIHGGKTAYGFSNDFSRAALLDLAESVIKAVDGSEQDVVINLKKRNPAVSFLIKIPPAGVPMASKINLVKTGNNTARKKDKRIRQARIIYSDAVQSVKIFTSDGYIAEDERVYTIGAVHAIASDDGIIQTGYEPVGGLVGFELFDNNAMEAIAYAAAERAVMMLTAKRARGGRMPVIISSAAGGTMIHEAIGHGLEADLAQEGLSVYSDKRGQQVASPVITVIDDSTMPNKRGSFAFDDEGTSSKRNVLVKNGVLLDYMYDKYTAMRGNTFSSGNGRRESYEHRPIPRMTNTYIAPSDIPPEDVIMSVTSGLFVKKMGGGQVNTVTGDFVFEVQEGYLIKDGRIGEPVRGATLIGNGPEVLKSIDMVASDLGFSIGTCGKDGQGAPVSDAMPTLRIPEIVVGGETS